MGKFAPWRTDGKGRPFETAVQAEKLQLLYHQSFPAVFMSMASAAMLALILWPHAERQALSGWLTAIAFASLLRLVLFHSYRRAAPRGAAVLAWRRPYFVTLMFSSLLWGLGGVWIMPADSLLFQAVTFYFLMGMAGGAVSVYSAIRPMALATIAAVLLPITLWMVFQDDRTALWMGLASLLFIFSAIRATRVLTTALHQSFQLTHELKAAHDAAEQVARTDALTGLNNRRAFSELAQAALQLAQRQGYPLSIIILDADHFKRINDSCGHAVGDLALKHLARIIREGTRQTDICARIGGEEFAVLMPDTNLEACLQVAEKLRRSIEQQPLSYHDGELSMTASLGAASGDRDLDALISQADQAMYRAKKAGRNRVMGSDGPE